MAGQRTDILVYGLRSGDATSQHTFAVTRALWGLGAEVRIHSNHPLGPLPTAIQPIARQTHYADYVPTADLTIVQYPLWYPLAERLRSASGAKLFWYHGVTPPALWTRASDREILRNAQIRTDLAWEAHLVVATSPFTAGELRTYTKLPADRIRIIPLGVELESFSRPHDAEIPALRRRWSLDGRRVLLYVGRIAGNKRLDLVVEALARLVPLHPNLYLLIVGDTQDGVVTRDLATDLRHQAERLGVRDYVTFTGRVPRVQPYYGLADVYVQASQHEGFGVPLVEAMAASVPVVASASGAMPWLLGADAPASECGAKLAGLLFEPGDVDDLVAKIDMLLTDEQRYAQFAEHGRRRAHEFGMERFYGRTQDLAAEVLQVARSGAPPGRVLSEHGEMSLLRLSDIARRDYRVRSNVPLVGRVVDWLRRQSTSHFKEAYFDGIVEQQVNFNRQFARTVVELTEAFTRLQSSDENQ